MPRNVFTPEQIGPELLATDKRIRAAALRGLRLAARLGEAEVKKEIRGNKPFPIVDLGELLRSPKVSRLEDGALLEVTAPHGTYQEFGTGPAAGNAPFTPPFDVIFEWVKRKGLAKRGGKSDRSKGAKVNGRRKPAKGRKRPKGDRRIARRPKSSLDPETAQIAGAIWQHMRIYGMKGKNYYGRASQKFQGHVDKMVARQVAKVTH